MYFSGYLPAIGIVGFQRALLCVFDTGGDDFRNWKGNQECCVNVSYGDKNHSHSDYIAGSDLFPMCTVLSIDTSSISVWNNFIVSIGCVCDYVETN